MPTSSVSNATKATVAVVVLALIAVAWVLATRCAVSGVSSYYPLAVGNSWTYETKQQGKLTGPTGTQESEKLGTVEQSVVGVSPLSSDELQVFELTQKSEERGPDGAVAASAESTLHISSTPTAISLHAVDFKEADSPALPAPVPMLTDPPSTEALTSETGSVQMSTTVTSQAPEAVEVPAGKFSDALKKVAEGPVTGEMSGVPVSSGTVTETTWFVRDVGIVKQVRVLDVTLQGPDGSELRIEERAERALSSFTSGTTAE